MMAKNFKQIWSTEIIPPEDEIHESQFLVRVGDLVYCVWACDEAQAKSVAVKAVMDYGCVKGGNIDILDVGFFSGILLQKVHDENPDQTIEMFDKWLVDR